MIVTRRQGGHAAQLLPGHACLLLLFSVHKGNERKKTAKSDRDTQEII